jgi:acetyltransferase-like isoleucine patch superfamily enzyme
VPPYQPVRAGAARASGAAVADRGTPLTYHGRMRRGFGSAIARRLGAPGRRVRRWWDRRTMPRFASVGPGFVMRQPRSVVGADRIHVGRDVKLGPGSELKANVRYPGGWMRHPLGEHVEQRFEPVIRIGDRVTATAALQVVAFREVVIEDDVMFASNVFVADGTHATTSGEVPYKYQGIAPVAPVRIGRGAWLGQNVVVLPGVTIGELAVVGANSVVTRDVPPRTVVAGVPARPVKTWDEASGAWRPADSRG